MVDWKQGDDGYLHHERTKTLQEVCDHLNSELKKQDLDPDEYGMDILLGYSRKGELIPPHDWIVCYAVTGGSEGHYIHVDAVSRQPGLGQPGKRYALFLGKSFQGMEFAYRVAKACADILEC